MPVVLARIDDRLIHGQVTEGWGKKIRPDVIVVVSDGVATTEWERELCLAALPDTICGSVVPVREAAGTINRLQDDRARAYVLFESPRDTFQAVEDGAKISEVNVGGLHSTKGKRRILDYVYLSDLDADYLKRIRAAGISLDFRDLPEHDRIDVSDRL